MKERRNDSDSDWLEISDMNEFTDYVRKMIYINFSDEEPDSDIQECFQNLGEAEKKEINEVLSLEECVTIVQENARKFKHKKTKEVKYIMDSDSFDLIILSMNQRMISNIIQGLTSRGFLDSAFDEEKNDFIFWVAQNKKDSEEQ